jgi:hypothetical protein
MGCRSTAPFIPEIQGKRARWWVCKKVVSLDAQERLKVLDIALHCPLHDVDKVVHKSWFLLRLVVLRCDDRRPRHI